MTVSLQRIDQLHKPDSFDDTLADGVVSASETNDVDYADHNNAKLTQLRKIIGGTNWYDPPPTDLTTLSNAGSTSEKKILCLRMNLNDVTVGGTDNFVLLTGTGKPDKVIAIGATQEGAVSAQLAGAIGANDLTEIAGSNALRPKNICFVFDGATGDALLSASRRIYGLLQVGSAATDGNAFTDAGNDQGQLSFVRPNATYDDLEACPAADIQGLSIIYAFTERGNLQDAPEEKFRGDLDSADPGAGVSQTLDEAYNGGHFIEVDASDLDWRFADSNGITMRKGAGGAILFQVQRDDVGTDLVQVAAAVDLFDVDAADSDFLQGATFDSGGQSINVGKTAVGVIDSTTIELRATTGDAEISAADDVLFQTVRETTALPLDDATAGAISALPGGPYASISAAIKSALDGGGAAVALTFKTYVAGANFGQDVNIPGATLDLTQFTIDANTPANTDAFVFLNGRLLYGGNGTTQNDCYAGDTPASGDLKVDFPKGIKSGDVILTIGLQ